jgi:hypothetical protein
MEINMRKIYLLLIMALIYSCSTPVSILPPGNLNKNENIKTNTEMNEVAPVSERTKAANGSAYDTEYSEIKTEQSIKPSKEFIRKMLPQDDINLTAVDFLTDNIESMIFIDKNHGFAAFSHQPTIDYADRMRLNFIGLSVNPGGTDIFEFNTDASGKIIFKNLGDKINSEFWDSHPFAISDTNSKGEFITLLIWSSDKNAPYSKAVNLKGDTLLRGNTDLFYSFKLADGSWTDVKSFTGDINSASNEGTPFVYCLCCNATLFFSSNRNNQDGHDFDIYSAQLAVNLDNNSISQIGNSKLIDEKKNFKDSEFTSFNTNADERFPYISLPYDSIPIKNQLYFSSNRYDKLNKQKLRKRDTIIENAGGYDLYSFPLPEEYKCPVPERPFAYLNIKVQDILNPENAVKKPVINLLNENGDIIAESIENNLRIKILTGRKYKVLGGSTYFSEDCGNDTKFQQYYFEPVDSGYVIGIDSLIEVSFIKDKSLSFTDYQKNKKIKIDSSESEMLNNNVISIRTTYKTIESINAKIENNKVVFDEKITNRYYWDKIEHKTLKRELFPVESGNVINSAQVPSEISRNGFVFVPLNQRNSPEINDVVYIMPGYFVKPPCHCEFINFFTNYEQNVPYFQTGFWEVNTSKNFRRDMRRLESNSFSEAKWIELHKNNKYFGEDRKGRLGRIYEYENYAKVVDKNIDKMTDVIVNSLIPAFNVIDSISENNKLIIQIGAWSDKRPVALGWYIGDAVDYYEGTLNEDVTDNFSLDFKKVSIKNGNSLNLNNDTLSKLRAFNGYKELLSRMSDSKKFGNNFKEYLDKGLVLLPEIIKESFGNKSNSKDNQELRNMIDKAKIIILTKGNYYDPTEYKLPFYVKDADSSLYMLDTVRRVEVIINTLEFSRGTLRKSKCCNNNLPCIEFNSAKNSKTTGTANTSKTAMAVKIEQTDDYFISFGTFDTEENADKTLFIAKNICKYELVVEKSEINDKVYYTIRTQNKFDSKIAKSLFTDLIKTLGSNDNQIEVNMVKE